MAVAVAKVVGVVVVMAMRAALRSLKDHRGRLLLRKRRREDIVQTPMDGAMTAMTTRREKKEEEEAEGVKGGLRRMSRRLRSLLWRQLLLLSWRRGPLSGA
jgi:hypothetical protein